MVVSSGACKVDNLPVFGQVFSECFGGEGGSTVTDVFSRDDSILHAESLILVQDISRLMGVQMLLHASKDVSTGGVNDDASTRLVVGIGSSAAGDVHSLGRANKVVQEGSLSHKGSSLLHDRRRLVLHNVGCWRRCLWGPDGLLSKLTSSTFGRVSQLADFGMEQSLLSGKAQHTSLHQKLNLSEVHVAATLMPSQPFLLCFTQIDVVGIHSCSHSFQLSGGLLDSLQSKSSAFWKVVSRIVVGSNRSAPWVSVKSR